MPGPFSVAKEAGDFYTYNIHHGFPEGLVRGYRSGFLTDMVRVVLFHLTRFAYYVPCKCTSRVQLRRPYFRPHPAAAVLYLGTMYVRESLSELFRKLHGRSNVLTTAVALVFAGSAYLSVEMVPSRADVSLHVRHSKNLLYNLLFDHALQPRLRCVLGCIVLDVHYKAANGTRHTHYLKLLLYTYFPPSPPASCRVTPFTRLCVLF